MKMYFLLSVFLLSGTHCVSGQQIRGVIYYMNSNGKTAAGVEVSAFCANSDYTDAKGMFRLTLVGKKRGKA